MPSSARPPHGFLAALAAAGALIGCAEEPSFQFSWRINADEAVEVPELRSVKQCSEAGIEKVRLEVYGVDDPDGAEPRFTHDYACFPPIADGPTLAAGEYTLELIGLRRNGGEWLCPGPDVDDDGQPIEDVPCVRASSSVTVSEGSLPEAKFVLDAPSQCDDGVDNDRDGRVDVSDPACELGEALEGYDAGRTLFQLTVGILANPLIEPDHVDIDAFRFEVDGMPLDTLLPVAGPGSSWPWKFPLLDMELDGGPHTISMVALADEAPLTMAQTYDFTVDDEQGAFVIHDFVLGSAEFLAPIEGNFNVIWGLGTEGNSSTCFSDYFAVDDVRARVVEGGGAPLAVDQVTVDGKPPLAEEAGGWLVFQCDDSGNLTSTSPLTWTDAGYSLEFEGRIGGVACFASGAVPLRPGDSLSVYAPRVLVDGKPLPGCEECVVDEDCNDVPYIVCDAGLCVDNPK